MKQLSTRFWLWGIYLICGGWAGCRPALLPVEPEVGQLDVSLYLAWGDAYSAGFRNTQWDPASLRGLYPEAQALAYPALLAGQLALAQPMTFTQPMTLGDGSGYLNLLGLLPAGCPGQPPQVQTQMRNSTPGWNEPVAAPIHNLALPHIRFSTLTADSLALINPFASRLSLHHSYHTHLATQFYTFATLWLGMEDVLGRAMTGAANVGYPELPLSTFVARYAALLEAMDRRTPTHFLVGNLPDLTQFPFFTTMPHRYQSAETCERAPQPIYFQRRHGGQVTTVVAGPQDCILLNARDQLGRGNNRPGSLGLNPDNPLPSSLVLDQEERSHLQAAIARYNSSLDSLVRAHNHRQGYQQAVLVDLWTWFAPLSDGLTVDGLTLSDDYLDGGIFAIDGLYFTPRGQAFVANAFIDAINRTDSWEASIPPLTLTDYTGVVFP